MKKIAFLLFAILLAVNAYSAFLRNIPVELKQPDGAVIRCFVTGDEFHRRVHDKDNYTIIQNPQTGYYVYASINNEELVVSENIVGKCNPGLLGIEPNLDIPYQRMEDNRTSKLKSAKIVAENLTKGDFNNIVISIRFSDQSPTNLNLSDYQAKFNSVTSLSLKSYFKEVSNSQLNVTTNFYPQPQNQTIVEYQDSHPRAYYSPYNAITNLIGYTESGWAVREQELVKNSIASVESQIIGSKVNYDLNNDGYVDNLIFIIQGSADTWGSILWPMSQTMDNSFRISIGNKLINQYNKQLSSWIDVGVLCHEFFHSLGARDLYHYSYDGLDPVGAWDIMNASLGQHMTTFMKWKYGKWFDTLPEITQPGTYTLHPLSKSPFACYKIPIPDNPFEYYILEYRKKEGLLESTIPINYDDGLIIYRINTNAQWGNASGPPDEVYIYRVNGTTTVNGDIAKAAFSSNSSRTSFNHFSNPFCFLSDGTKDWIDISNVTSSGNEISFTINPISPLYSPRNLTASKMNNQVLLKWNSPIKKGSSLLGYNVYLDGSKLPLNSTIITDTTFQTPIPGQKATYSYSVTAKYQKGESDPAIYNLINSETPSVKDSLALVTLYNQCNGPNWTRKANWLSGLLSTWEGVAVENGRVVKLNLGDRFNPSVGLIGQLPDELANLTEIKYMSFWRNQLTGTLPENWSTLSKLQYLFLNENQFSGPLPQSWSALINLEDLEITTNQLTGTLPESWSALINLKFLWLSQNQLTGTLPKSWLAMVKLWQICLYQNQLTGNLPDDWSKMASMKDLELGVNQFSGTLPESWSDMKDIEFLSLQNNQLTGTLPSSWSSLVKLIGLYLDQNQLTGNIPDSWSTLLNLEHFCLSRNKFSGPLPNAITNYLKLKWLKLDYNQFTGPLPSEWSSKIFLLQLQLEGNQFTGTFPQSWSSLINLTRLTVGKNQLTGTLPEYLSNFVNLTQLSFDQNQFTGSLPESWSSLVNLWDLRLNSNQLTGTLPASWSTFSKLQNLDLSMNNLSGTIPESWTTFKNIFSLNLSQNQLSGVLPKSWSSYEALWYLFLGGNQFSGSLPDSWSALTNLSGLNLGKNNLTGDVPPSWSSLTKLVTFSISSNQITGLPNMSACTKMDMLLVDDNRLDFGDIEPNIGIAKTRFDYLPQPRYFGKSEISTKIEGDQLTLTAEMNGTSNIYQWYKNSIPMVGQTSSDISFKSLSASDKGYYYCIVKNSKVPDLTFESEPLQVEIISTNHTPSANAGFDQSVNESATVSLDGSASSDPDGNPLTYKWTAPVGITLSSTSVAKPTFTAPEVKKDSILNFSLVVNDGLVSSLPATVKVTILNVIKVGVTPIESPLVKVYPNPTKGIIQVEFCDFPESGTWITVYNISGKTICKWVAKNKIETLNLNNHPTGLYLVRIDQKLPKTYKIVLEKTESVH